MSNVTILCHRGWWQTPEEQNTLPAFARALDAGLGVEVDVRDWAELLVVSHDPPSRNIRNGLPVGCFRFTDLVDLLAGRPNVVAVNVKSCGLAPLFAAMPVKPPNWFFFDVAPGDEEPYLEHYLPIFRRGDFRGANPALLVSDEIFLADEDPVHFWSAIRESDRNVYLLTDRPAAAVEFFR